MIGCGFWKPNARDLLLVRRNWELDASEMRSLMKDKKVVERFGGLKGDQVRTAPKGFSRDHPDIDLIRYRQWILTSPLSDDEVVSPDLADYVVSCFVTARPWFDYMSNLLTHDLNGEALY